MRPRPSFKKCGSRNDISCVHKGHSRGYNNSFQRFCGGGTLNVLGTNLFQAFRLCPPSVPTDPVNRCSSINARAGCQPPKFPDALPRHKCDAKRLPAVAISRAVLTMISAFTPLSFSANCGVNFA